MELSRTRSHRDSPTFPRLCREPFELALTPSASELLHRRRHRSHHEQNQPEERP
jgi:hypothetical protein